MYPFAPVAGATYVPTVNPVLLETLIEPGTIVVLAVALIESNVVVLATKFAVVFPSLIVLDVLVMARVFIVSLEVAEALPAAKVVEFIQAAVDPLAQTLTSVEFASKLAVVFENLNVNELVGAEMEVSPILTYWVVLAIEKNVELDVELTVELPVVKPDMEIIPDLSTENFLSELTVKFKI